MGEGKAEKKRKTREIGEDGFCKHFFEDLADQEKEYVKEGNDFSVLSGVFRSYITCNTGLFDNTSGYVPFPKWVIKAVSDAFEKYYQRKNVEYDLDTTLDEAFGINEDKLETIRKLHARNREDFFGQLNNIRMFFGLNVKDAAQATWKITEYRKKTYPTFFYKFNASKESLLDAYHRAYPQHKFIQWVAERPPKDTPFDERADKHLKWIEDRVPEAAAYIRRKMKIKPISANGGHDGR